MTSANTTRTQKSSGPQRPQPAKPGETSSLDTTIVADSPLAWITKFAKRLLAHSLNMPEPLLHDTGVFVFAHVQAVEDRAARTLCPFTLLRQLLACRSNRKS